jgi:hypothetical protein
MKIVVDIICILGFVLVSVLCLVAMKFGNEWAMKMMDTIVPMVIMCWITNFTTIINYHKGTSASSQRKSDLISKMVTGDDRPVDLLDEVKK